jgi:hypothetical protein
VAGLAAHGPAGRLLDVGFGATCKLQPKRGPIVAAICLPSSQPGSSGPDFATRALQRLQMCGKPATIRLWRSSSRSCCRSLPLALGFAGVVRPGRPVALPCAAVALSTLLIYLPLRVEYRFWQPVDTAPTRECRIGRPSAPVSVFSEIAQVARQRRKPNSFASPPPLVGFTP